MAVGLTTAGSATALRSGATLAVSARVNGATNAEVTWTLSGPSCPSSCGTITPTSTSAAIYSAPSSVPVQFTVTVTATSVQDPSKRGSVTLIVNSDATPFPLAVHSSGRYLVDGAGAPFPLLGRTAWFVVSLSAADSTTFLDDTVAKGFTAIELHVIDHDPRGNNPPFANNDPACVAPCSLLPFTSTLTGASWTGFNGTPDFSTPNEPYWAFVDDFVAAAEQRGILLLLFPAYVGFAGTDQGWMSEMVENGAARMQSYGAFIANRYRSRGNIVWMMGGDDGTFDSSQTTVEQALITGLKSVAGQASTNFSAEWGGGMICTDQGVFGSNCTLNGTYNWDEVGGLNAMMRRGWAYSTPTMPSFLLEEPYDQEGPDGTNVNRYATQPTRRFEIGPWLGGIAGYVAGNGYVWPFKPGVWSQPAHLDSSTTQDLARFNALVKSLQWWKLVPSGASAPFIGRKLVPSGETADGTGSVTAAQASDGSFLLVYLPPTGTGTQTITVDPRGMADTARARWWNPTSGEYTNASPATLANTAPQGFTTPGDNGTGTNDWVLVLDSPAP